MTEKVSLSRDTPICRSPWTPYQILDGEAIIVHSRTRGLHRLNETGTEIWKFLETPKTVLQIMEHLKDEFEAPSDEELFNDVCEFLGELLEHDVFRVAK